MKNSFAAIFGALIAFILLILYAGTVIYMIIVVLTTARADPGSAIEFSDGLIIVVTTIGGLVSALVIAKLAITDPNKTPTIIRLTVRDDGTQSRWATGLVWAYLTIWFIVGLASLIIGVMLYPKVNQVLNDIGTTWLGLAIAGAYAYFGITPSQ